MSTQWFCCRVYQGKDRFSAMLLETKGFEVYMPVYLAEIKGKEGRVKLFLPGYLFIRIDQGEDSNELKRRLRECVGRRQNATWRAALSTHGIKSVLLSSGKDKPQVVHDWIIEEIKEREVDGVIRLPPRETCKFEPGQIVKVKGSPLDVVFEEVDDDNRAIILVKMFDRQYRKLVPITKLHIHAQ